MGPGAGYVDKPFGSDVKHKMHFGGKYEFKPLNRNPSSLKYDVKRAEKLVYKKPYEAFIDEKGKIEQPVGVDAAIASTKGLPEGGKYDGHLTPFGADIKTKVNMGSKYKSKYNDNPGPGVYHTDRGHLATSKTARSAVIRENVSTYRRPDENLPEPGTYTGHLTKFGANVKSNINFGSKYKFKPDTNPPPGAYDTARGI